MASRSNASAPRAAQRVASPSPKPTGTPPGVDEAIRAAALALFVERGFHGTSMRDIATSAGTNVSHLYYYFASKDEVLKSMMIGIVDDLLSALDRAQSAVADAPRERLLAIVQAQVLFHSQRQAEAFIGRSELRSLSPEAKPEIDVRYDRVTSIFARTIADGVRQGVFDCVHTVEATSAIVTMCNGVSSWYRADRGLSPQTLARRYGELALRMVGASR